MKNRWWMFCMSFCAFGVHGALIEEVIQIPVEVTDLRLIKHHQSITVTVFREDVREKSPFLVLNHGRDGSANGRRKLGRARYTTNAEYFVRRGFAVFVPTRVGYGVTGGPDVEDTGPCAQRNYPRAFEAAAAQTEAVLHYAKTQAYIDPTRGLLIGQSFGGAASVALTAKNIDGVKGAINFAGGAGGNPTSWPENPCSEPLLAQAYAGYGKTAKTPMLWLYSENDRFWGKELPLGWFEGFQNQGGIGKFVQLPPSGSDGHGSFTANPGAWKPYVESFLKSIGFAD